MGETRPRVALLGAREDEIELLAELHRSARVVLTGVYDPDPHAPGLAVAEIAGVPAGADLEARQRLGQAEFVVLPSDRMAFHEAIDWCSGLHGQLVALDEARRRWGSASSVGPGATTPATSSLIEMDRAGARLASRSELADWLLDIAMRAVGATGGSIQLVAPQTEQLYVLTARGLSEEVVRSARHPLGEPISGLTASMRTPQLLHGPQHRHLPSDRAHLTSALSVPLETIEGSLVGVLNVSTTVRGKRFVDEDLTQLTALAPHAARLLSRAHPFELATHQRGDQQLFETLRELEERGAELGDALRTLCNEMRGRIEADSIGLYLSTEDGDWLQIALDVGAEGHARVRRSAAARAFVERTWLHLVEFPDHGEAPDGTEPTDEIDAALERALAVIPDEGATLSCVYAPLLGTSPVGVLAATFSSLAQADAFVRHGEPMLRNIALYVETRLRERRSRRLLERAARLGQALPKLLDARVRGDVEQVLVREAALLVAAERVLLRHVDEERRTYSRPIVHGVPEAQLDAWRQLDARVTEKTLERRTVEATTAVRDPEDDLTATVGYRTLVSVPVHHDERLVAVLNVYDKLPADPLEGRSFHDADCALLEDFARVVASLLSHEAASEPSPPPSPLRAEVPEPTPVPAPSFAAAAPLPAPRVRPSPLETDSVRLREELKREVARAQRHQREMGVTLMHVKGLQELDEVARDELLVEIMRLVRHYTRSSDLVGWYGPDRLMIVSPESVPGCEELEARLRRLLRESVHDDAETALDVRVGSSSYPDDGDDASALLQTAAARLR